MASEQYSLVEMILSHLCGKGIYGDVTEWCEMRRDCVYVVTCPDCNDTFTLGEDEYEALVQRSQEVGLSGGIRPLPA